MRLQILSDLHLEFGDYKPPRTNADVIVLAGDIHQGSQGIEWAQRHFARKPVIYVMGNHEFYGYELKPLMERCRAEIRGGNIFLLENQSIQIGGVTFLGCALWTDFRLWPKPAEAMEAARDYMNDFKLIRTPSGRLRPLDTIQFHQTSVAWLKSQLKTNDPKKTVVITHHAPSGKSIPPQHAGGVLSAAFASDLDSLVRASRVPLWIHGHTHYNVDYKISATRIYSNQRGYPEEKLPRFEREKIIEIL
ncbi:MAG: metallophosphoesterase [Verrucomicrobiota bacterium]|nr:metallophosphoesterase [Verrucomicrobiota bacterium]